MPPLARHHDELNEARATETFALVTSCHTGIISHISAIMPKTCEMETDTARGGNKGSKRNQVRLN